METTLTPAQEINALEIDNPRLTYTYKPRMKAPGFVSPPLTEGNKSLLPKVNYKSTLLRPSAMIGGLWGQHTKKNRNLRSQNWNKL